MKAPLDFPPYTRFWRASVTKKRHQAKVYLDFCSEITKLFGYFGFTVMSMDPGIAIRKGNAKKYRAGDCIDLDAPAFREVVPLLHELRALREANATPAPARRAKRRVADRAIRH